MNEPRRYNYPNRRAQKPKSMTHREAVRIARISVCVIIVGAAVAIKALFPSFVDNIRDDALRILSGNVDYEAALAVMGKVAAGEESIGDGAVKVYEYAFKISDSEAVEAMEDDTKAEENTEKTSEKADYEY